VLSIKPLKNTKQRKEGILKITLDTKERNNFMDGGKGPKNQREKIFDMAKYKN